MGYVDKQTMSVFIKGMSCFDNQENKLMSIGYSLFSLRASGVDTEDLDKAFRVLDINNGVCVNQQFLELTDNPLAKKIVSTRESHMIAKAYKVKGMRIISELKTLEGLVNSIKLNNLIAYVRDSFLRVGELYENCFGKVTFNEIVTCVVDNILNLLDDVYNTLIIKKAQPVEKLCV